MGRVGIVAWRGNTDAVVRSSARVHVVTMVVAIIQVRITVVSIRATPGMEVVEVMGSECT